MKIWSTKYALTQGIMILEAEPTSTSPNMVRIPPVDGLGGSDYIHKPYWHLSELEALNHASILAARKINSLRKQIAKIEKMNEEWSKLFKKC